MLFFAFPQLASLLPLSSPNQKMAGLGLQTIQAAPGARFHAKPVVPGREVMASQWKARRCMLWKMVSSYGNLWKQWGKKHIKMILIDFGYPYSISRVYMKWNICRSLHSKSFWKTRHDLNLLTKWKKIKHGRWIPSKSYEYPLYKVYLGLIIRGTIPREPAFFLWISYLSNKSLFSPKSLALEPGALQAPTISIATWNLPETSM